MMRAILSSAILCVGALSIALGAMQAGRVGQTGGSSAPAPNVIELQKVRDTLYLLKGGGGNTAVFITDLGVVLVDTKLAGWGQPMMDKIKTITTKPVTTIINTHAHGDHTGSNEFFGTAVEIVAHENTRGNMDRMEAFTGNKVNYLPKLMFKDRMSLGAGKDKIELLYLGAGHTSGDAWVVFPALRVMHAGDIFAGKQLPIIDGKNGGSGLAYPESLARAAATIKNVDAIVTGHGGIMTMADLEEYARFTRDFRDVVVDGFNHGLSVAAVVERWNLPVKYKGYAAASADRVKADVEQTFGELALSPIP